MLETQNFRDGTAGSKAAIGLITRLSIVALCLFNARTRRHLIGWIGKTNRTLFIRSVHRPNGGIGMVHNGKVVGYDFPFNKGKSNDNQRQSEECWQDQEAQGNR